MGEGGAAAGGIHRDCRRLCGGGAAVIGFVRRSSLLLGVMVAFALPVSAAEQPVVSERPVAARAGRDAGALAPASQGPGILDGQVLSDVTGLPLAQAVVHLADGATVQ